VLRVIPLDAAVTVSHSVIRALMQPCSSPWSWIETVASELGDNAVSCAGRFACGPAPAAHERTYWHVAISRNTLTVRVI
jgi:hypothetical protein